MIGNDDSGRRWSIGEVARASRLTVRTLHHYDEIGLVRASERTASGHRRYTGDDLRRLYRVRALRSLGLSLDEIDGALTGAPDDPAAVRDLLAAQLRGLRDQARRLDLLQRQISGLLEQVGTGSMPDPDRFMTTLEMMSVFESTFTPEERERLAERRAALGAGAVEAAKTEWAGLVEELLRHLGDGTPVDDPRVQDLVARWDALGGRFHGGDDRTAAAAREMWAANSEELGRNLPWPTDRLRDLVRYLEQARNAR
ncbi:MerR family transcriptional regulator [Nocardiopsis sediminis]|uniref:MerR family transcriptional regulator n=1 Tax=Nocardiopsis sediminis TaxID=1778267 RepID=A0ABV8FUA5_9ACTN